MVAPLGPNSIKVRGANFRYLGTGGCLVCVSCFACSWSSWTYQNPFSPGKQIRKISKGTVILPEKFEISSPPASPQKLVLGRGSKFYVGFDSTGLSWVVSSKRVASTCSPSVPDGISIETVCCNLLFAVFPSFDLCSTALFIILIWFLCVHII